MVRDLNTKIWDRVYNEISDEKLPWKNIKLPKKIFQKIDSLDKNKLIIITGCGTGDILKQINNLGFKKIIGTDISKKAIDIAKTKNPKYKFRKLKTQDLYKKFSNINVFDLFVLHHISKEELKKYIYSLDVACDTILIVFFINPAVSQEKSNVKRESNIFYHNPDKISRLFNCHALADEFKFRVSTNPMFGKKLIFRAVCQYYLKK
jgi:hypothetical protein